MATSGNIQTNSAFGYVKLSWNVASQNVENNTSTIKYELSIYRTSSIQSTASKSYWIKINGITVASGTNTIGGSGTKVLKSGTTTIPHNADGTKTFDLSFSQEIEITWNGSWIGTITGSGNGTLDTIPRASSPSLHASSLDFGQTLTIYTNRASENFKHVLEYKIGSLSGTIASGVEAYHYWGIPTSLMNAIPSATSGTITITCHTYNGSSYLGTKTTTLTANVPSSVIPSCSLSISEGVDGLNAKIGAYVQNHSKAKVSITAQGVYGSTIKSYKTTINGVSYSGASFTSNILNKSGTIAITTIVTDTRGRTNTTTQNISVLAYATPQITLFSCARANANGTENNEGKYLKATINFAITSLNSKNDKYYYIYAKEKSANTWTTVASGSVYSLNSSVVSSSGLLELEKSYDIRLEVRDYFAPVYASFDIGTSFTLIDFNASGKAMAFGKVSEQDEGLEIALATTFTNAPRTDNYRVLWEGSDVMSSTTEITLNESISNQMFGICLVFRREGSGQYFHYNSFFIPKGLIQIGAGGGHSFIMTSEWIYLSCKYLYITDTKIKGHTMNTTEKGDVGTTGFILNNNVYKLCYVFGI